MKKMLWVAAVSVLGLANTVNGQCCHESVEMFETTTIPAVEMVGVEMAPVMFESAPIYAQEPIMLEGYGISGVSYETPMTMEVETFGVESEFVVTDAEPVVFGTVETVGTEVLMGGSIEYPFVESVDGCGCWGYSPMIQYGEVVSFDGGEVVELIDNDIVEGEIINESESTFTSAPVVEAAGEEPADEAPSDDEGENEEALDDESDEDSEPTPFDRDEVVDDEDEGDFDDDEEELEDDFEDESDN